jgi:hypothetical protein
MNNKFEDIRVSIRIYVNDDATYNIEDRVIDSSIYNVENILYLLNKFCEEFENIIAGYYEINNYLVPIFIKFKEYNKKITHSNFDANIRQLIIIIKGLNELITYTINFTYFYYLRYKTTKNSKGENINIIDILYKLIEYFYLLNLIELLLLKDDIKPVIIRIMNDKDENFIIKNYIDYINTRNTVIKYYDNSHNIEHLFSEIEISLNKYKVLIRKKSYEFLKSSILEIKEEPVITVQPTAAIEPATQVELKKTEPPEILKLIEELFNLSIEKPFNNNYIELNELFDYTFTYFNKYIIILNSIEPTLIITIKNIKKIFNIIKENKDKLIENNKELLYHILNILGTFIKIFKISNNKVHHIDDIRDFIITLLKILELKIKDYPNNEKCSYSKIYQIEKLFDIDENIMQYIINKILIFNKTFNFNSDNIDDIDNISINDNILFKNNTVNYDAYALYQKDKSTNDRTIFIDYIKTFLEKFLLFYLLNDNIINLNILYNNLISLLNNIKSNDNTIDISLKIKYLKLFINHFIIILYYIQFVKNNNNSILLAIFIETIELLYKLIDNLENNNTINYTEINEFNIYRIEWCDNVSTSFKKENIDSDEELIEKNLKKKIISNFKTRNYNFDKMDYKNFNKTYDSNKIKNLIIHKNFYSYIIEKYINSFQPKILLKLNEILTSSDAVTIGGNNKYKKTDKQITVIYKKKEYTRVIYICERKKYVKINKTFMLLSKLKKI